MARRIIVVGDPTDHGGTVVSGSASHTVDGKAIARLGDKVNCPRKYPDGSPHGVNPIVEGEAACPSAAFRSRSRATERHAAAA